MSPSPAKPLPRPSGKSPAHTLKVGTTASDPAYDSARAQDRNISLTALAAAAEATSGGEGGLWGLMVTGATTADAGGLNPSSPVAAAGGGGGDTADAGGLNPTSPAGTAGGGGGGGGRRENVFAGFE